MDIYKEALEKMDSNDIDHWQSDLYLRKNSISEKIISEYEYKNQVQVFKDNIDHVLWYDIPFGYANQIIIDREREAQEMVKFLNDRRKREMFELKPMFANLQEISPEPEFKLEWSDDEYKQVNKAIKNLFGSKTVTDHRGQTRTLYTMDQIEDFFGLPYTSSSSLAMVSNCNTRLCVDKEEQYNIEYFALTKDNKVVMVAWDKDENEKDFVIG